MRTIRTKVERIPIVIRMVSWRDEVEVYDRSDGRHLFTLGFTMRDDKWSETLRQFLERVNIRLKAKK